MKTFDGVEIDLTKAHDRIIVRNRAERPYSPYCMRCEGMHRMAEKSPFLWMHFCGAVHDETQVLV
jgi:hypothetical protein